MSERKLLLGFLLCWCQLVHAQTPAATEGPEWHSLFNGRDLSGWTIKIAKHPLNENYRDTFRVDDGIIKVVYDKYDKFDEQFGHLYSNLAYSNYILRGSNTRLLARLYDSPPWSKLNSGVMIHSQSPLSLELDQLWPRAWNFSFSLQDRALANKQATSARRHEPHDGWQVDYRSHR